MASAEVDLPLGYRDPRFLGGGGRARVYRCVDAADGDEVAVKLFDRTLDDPVDGAATFHRQCRTARTLGAHPGVVRVRAAGVTASARPWLAMDLAANGTLAELIERSGGALPLAHALDITATLADTLAWAHQLEPPVVHGDVQPAAILLDAEWRPLMGGFADRPAPAGPYAAPEALRDRRPSVAADVWSLTATLFEMVAGTPPFVMEPDEDLDGFVDRVARGLPATAIPATVPPVVADILRNGLAVDGDERTPGMAVLAQAVRAAQIQLKLPMAAPVPRPGPGDEPELPFVDHTEPVAPATGDQAAPPPAVTAPKPDGETVPTPPRRRRAVWIAVAAGLALALTGAGIAVAGSHHGVAPHAGASATNAHASAAPASATNPAPGPTTRSPGRPTPSASGSATNGSGPTINRPRPTFPDPITAFTVIPTGVDGQARITFDAPASHGPSSTIGCYLSTTNCGYWSMPVDGAAGVTRTINGLPNGQAATVRLQDCNGNTCGTVIRAQVTVYGPMNGLSITPSASGPTVNFTISVNPDGKPATVQVTTSRQSQTFTTGVTSWTWSGSDDVGYNGSDTIAVTVTDAGRTTLSQQVSQSTPPPPPTVTVSRGAPCGGGGGAACAGGTCSNTSCGYIHVVTANFTGNVSCTFNSDHGTGGWIQNVTWGANQGKDAPNWYGWPGSHVYVTCGGVTGSFIWP